METLKGSVGICALEFVKQAVRFLTPEFKGTKNFIFQSLVQRFHQVVVARIVCVQSFSKFVIDTWVFGNTGLI